MYSPAALSTQNSFYSPSFSSPPAEALHHQEMNLAATTSPSSSSFSHYQSPTNPGARSLVNALIRLLETGSPTSREGGKEQEEKLDIVSLLPPEVSVMVLQFLHPRDLCNATMVSSKWHQLTLCDALQKKRLDYLQHKCQEYQKSKLRYPLSPHNTNPHVTFRPFSPVAMAPVDGSSPLHTRHHHSNPTSPSPVSWESPQRNHTPSPTFLAEDVRRLSLNDCQDDLTSTSRKYHHNHQRSLSTEQESRLENALYTFRLHTTKEVAGRKANKNRLRRLSLLS